MNQLVMFANLAPEEESVVKVVSSYATAFCELSIAILVSLSSK